MTDLLPFDPTGDPLIDRAVRHWGQGSLLPRQYRIDQQERGGPDWPNLIIGATTLRTLDVEPFPNLPDTYVVHGRVGFMHGLQAALAARQGVDITEIYSDDTTATVCIRRPGEQRGHDVTVTLAEATRAGWVKRNPCYTSMPRRMLLARATTAAIDRYAPGVLRGIASTVQPIAALDTEAAPPAGGGGVGPQDSATSPAPAGYMTTEAPDTLRAELLVRLDRLRQVDPEAFKELRAEWKALGGPVINYPGASDPPLFLPDALVLRYMLEETEDALEASGGAADIPTDTGGAAPASGGTEPDDTEYGTWYNPEDGRTYADDDTGRPF